MAMTAYTYTTLDGPLGTGANLFGINDTSQIVGSYTDYSGGSIHGFVYSNGVYATLDDPQGAGITQAQGINDTGQIVGSYTDGSLISHGCLYSNGVYTTVDDPLGTLNTAQGINDTGQIVGITMCQTTLASTGSSRVRSRLL
jgi:probable HAF family extracellular repeat protein